LDDAQPDNASELGFLVGAGEGNRTLMTSLEGWGSAIELRPHDLRAASVAYRFPEGRGALEGSAALGHPSPLVNSRQVLARALDGAEEIAPLGYPVKNRPDRELIRPQGRIFELSPVNRR
jgi:hypothetical protein